MNAELIPFAPARKRHADPSPAWGREPDGTLWIRCACGLPVTLDPEQHSVADDGTVTPSVWHDDCPAGWHENVKLAEWSTPPARISAMCVCGHPAEYHHPPTASLCARCDCRRYTTGAAR